MTDQFPLTITDQNLLTVFVAITTLAILIQTGLLAGVVLMTWRVSRRAEQALQTAQGLFAPLQNAVESLQSATARIRMISSNAERRLHFLERRRRAA